jgi:hypothetical protein
MGIVEDVLSNFQSVLAKMEYCIINAESEFSTQVQNAFQPSLNLQEFPTAVAVMAKGSKNGRFDGAFTTPELVDWMEQVEIAHTGGAPVKSQAARNAQAQARTPEDSMADDDDEDVGGAQAGGEPKKKKKRKGNSNRATQFYYRGRAMNEEQTSGMISASMWCPKALFFVDQYNEQINATMRAVEEYYRRRVMVIALPPTQKMYQLTFGPGFQYPHLIMSNPPADIKDPKAVTTFHAMSGSVTNTEAVLEHVGSFALNFSITYLDLEPTKLLATSMDDPSFCASSAELCTLFFIEVSTVY